MSQRAAMRNHLDAERRLAIACTTERLERLRDEYEHCHASMWGLQRDGYLERIASLELQLRGLIYGD